MTGIQSGRKARCEEVIIYEELLGDGTKEDLYRILTVVRAKDGTFIAERDVWKEQHEENERKE